MLVFLLIMFVVGCATVAEPVINEPVTVHVDSEVEGVVSIDMIDDIDTACGVCDMVFKPCSDNLGIMVSKLSCSNCVPTAIVYGDTEIDEICMSKAFDCNTASKCVFSKDI